MASAAFDTLKYAEALKTAGIPDDQAKAQAVALADARKESAGEIATKTDLLELETRLVERIAKVEGRLNLVQWMLGFNLALSVALL